MSERGVLAELVRLHDKGFDAYSAEAEDEWIRNDDAAWAAARALLAQPDASREGILEGAARVCDALSDGTHITDESSDAAVSAFEQCAAAIRALGQPMVSGVKKGEGQGQGQPRGVGGAGGVGEATAGLDRLICPCCGRPD
jgi:hypothetical protein